MTEDQEELKVEEERVVEEALAPAEVREEPNSTALIDKANEAADRLDASNKELARLLAIQQNEIIQKKFDGQTTAGLPTKTKDEQDIENAKTMLKGTGMEELAFPPKPKD